jgi:serine/threonine protein kinase
MAKRGGKYINSGTFGCVFSPPIPCEDSSPPGGKTLVGKVFEFENEAKEEEAYVKTIASIDKTGAFTIKALKTCKIDPKKAQPTDQLGKCEYISSRNLQIIYKNGGVDLHTIERDPSKYHVFFDDMIPHFAPIFEGLVQLIKHGVMHCDIKPANMLYNPKTKKISLIDFGMMSTTSSFLENMLTRFDQSYLYYPPETLYLYRLYYQKKSKDDVRFVISSLYTSFGIWIFKDEAWRFIESYTPMYNDIELTYKRYTSYKTPQAMIDGETPGIVETFDVFGLGMALMEIYYFMVKHARIRDLSYCDGFIRQVVVQMICFDMTKRADAVQALASFKEFLAPKKDVLTRCLLPPSEGGYTIKELRKVAEKSGIVAKSRKEICKALSR